MKTIISTPSAPAAIGPYSQANLAGNTLYLSGQIGIDPSTGELAAEDVAGQARQVMANMRAVLAAAGASPEQVCKTTVFLTNIADFAVVNEIYAQTFSANAPARSCVAVAALPKGAKVEVEAIAVL
ncbi:MAG: RidA family protein [Desulfovibrio sp.]|jgi:2-iminobutanoate/2-iminopropanoate deaminase